MFTSSGQTFVNESVYYKNRFGWLCIIILFHIVQKSEIEHLGAAKFSVVLDGESAFNTEKEKLD